LDENVTCAKNKENIFALSANKDIKLIFNQIVSGQIDISEDLIFSSYKSFAIPNHGSLYLNAYDLESDNQYMYIRIVPLEDVVINSTLWSDPYPLTRTFAVNTVGSFKMGSYNYRLPYAEIKDREL
jgi:type II restriction/modification system DNA methylase subunit YeeA